MKSTTLTTSMIGALALIAVSPLQAGAGDNGAGAASRAAFPIQNGPRIDPPLCYDFSNMTVGEEISLGTEVPTQNGVVRLKSYLINGTPSQNGNNKASAQPSSLAEGTAPELWSRLVTPLVVLDEPASFIKMRFAENWGGIGPHNNIIVNGFRREVNGSLASVDGMVVVGPAGNKHRVGVTMFPRAPDYESDWHAGELRITALDGQTIHKFAASGHQFKTDDVCIYDNLTRNPVAVGNVNEPVAKRGGRRQRK